MGVSGVGLVAEEFRGRGDWVGLLLGFTATPARLGIFVVTAIRGGGIRFTCVAGNLDFIA